MKDTPEVMEDIDQGLIFDGKGQAISHIFKNLDQDYCGNKCSYYIFTECEIYSGYSNFSVPAVSKNET